MKDKILIVDDSPVNLRLLGSILDRNDFDLVEATDGEQGIAAALREKPDLILLDIMMPGRDGYEVCRELKGRSEAGDIPIIFLSALGESADKIKGLELGAADYVTKPFDRGEVLARVRNQLRIRHLHQSLTVANARLKQEQQRLEEDLKAAAEVQAALLPQAPFHTDRLDVSWLFKPCESLGGDIFNVLPVGENHVFCHIVDVSGHGAASALITASIAQSLSPQGKLILTESEENGQVLRTPASILQRLDEEYPMERFGKYFTISLLILDTSSGLLSYSSAAHPPPLLVRREGGLEKLEAGGPIIGLEGILPFEEEEVGLCPGDRLFLYTDGITELRSPRGELFGEDRLCTLLEEQRTSSVEELCEAVLRRLDSFSEKRPPDDDISLLAIEFSQDQRQCP